MIDKILLKRLWSYRGGGGGGGMGIEYRAQANVCREEYRGYTKKNQVAKWLKFAILLFILIK